MRQAKTYSANRKINGEFRPCSITVDAHGKEHVRVLDTHRKEPKGREWTHVFYKGKPAIQNHRTGEIRTVSPQYINRHHPHGGPWNS